MIQSSYFDVDLQLATFGFRHMNSTKISISKTFTFLLFAIVPTPTNAADRLSEAQMAAVNGDHARCAAIANDVRKSNDTSWYANQVYASCTSLDARKTRDKVGADKFKINSMKAIEAIEEIVIDGKGLTSRQRIKFSHMAVEMRKQLALDLAEMKTAPR